MSNAVAIPTATRADVFIGQVLPPERMDQVLRSLPSHVKPERFQRNLVVAVTQHPRLLDCDPIAVFNEVSKAAALGLYLDPQLGEAYLITGFSNGRYVPQLRLGYRGMIKLARQSGSIASVYAHDVCQNDKFRMALGTDKRIEHEPDYMTDRGEIGLYYAVVRFADGETDFEPMSLKEIHRIRDRSDGWKAFKAGKIKSTPWGTDEGEMAKKTVLRRLLKRLPQSPEIAEALRIDDDDFRDGEEAPARLSLSARLSADKPTTGFSVEHVEIETNNLAKGTISNSVEMPPGSLPDAPADEAPPTPPSSAGNNSEDSPAGRASGEGGGDDAASTAGDTSSPPLPEGWGIEYAAALRRAQKKESLPKYASQFWDQRGGWSAHKDGPNGLTAVAIYDAFWINFGNKDAIEAELRELI